MGMDKKKAAVVLEGLRRKYEAIRAESEFAPVYQEIVAAIDMALEALHGQNEPRQGKAR